VFVKKFFQIIKIFGEQKKGKDLRSTKAFFRNKRQLSSYNTLIRSKQSLKDFYTNLQEKKFKKDFKFCVKSSVKTLDKFISFVESRLDVILYRVGFVSSLHQARQFINHGHITVNNKKVYLASTKIYNDDLIRISKNNSFLKKVIYFNISSYLFSRSTILHLEVNYKLLNIIFLWEPDVKSTFFPVKTNYTLISRFYK